MATVLGSQASAAANVTLTNLMHDIFVGRVVNNVKRESPVAMMFQDAGAGEYRLEGTAMKFAVDLRFKTGAMATDGKLPNATNMDAQEGSITPIRRYARLAIDNMFEKQASGPGAYDNLSDRVFDQLWDSWKSMEIRHSIGPASGLLGVIESTDTPLHFVMKDAFGNVGTNPIAHISEGSILALSDATDSYNIVASATVSSINYSTREVVMSTEWDEDVTPAAGDYIYFATSPTHADGHFTSEKNLAPNGLGTIVDPAAAATTVHGILETDYPRWKPFRKASSTFDHLELTEHWLQLGAKRGFAVSPQSDVVVAFPAAVAQIARGLMGFQQQADLGGELKGGYKSLTVGGIPIVQDHFFYHNVAMTLNKDSLFRVNLGDEASFFNGDGSQFARIADYDGKEAFVCEYMNTFCNARGTNGAITGIVTPDITDEDYSAVPSY